MVINCVNCNDSFDGYKNRLYCKAIKIKSCKFCQEPFFYSCDKRERPYCSSLCNRRYVKSIKSNKECLKCGESFLGSFDQKYCKKEIYLKCRKCAKTFIRVCNKKYSSKFKETCDSVCWNLSDKVLHVKEYKGINKWAILFKKEHGRKPAINDVRKYFNVRNLPSFANKELFRLNKQGYSFLEETVFLYISELLPNDNILRCSRPLRDKNGRLLEIDVLIEDKSIGFEIQDLATHSKVSDSEISRYNDLKKGPLYHEKKRALALSLGIKLFDIWEEDILNGDFKTIIEDILK